MWALCLACLGVLSSILYHIIQREKRQLPKGFRHARASGVPPRQSLPNRDRYSRKKVPPALDAIVIGSGMGGLSCAALMARAGRRVLVLEQHYIAGGATHAFKDGGYEFDTGVHYVGNIDKRKRYLRLITRPGDEIQWDPMGRHPWDAGGPSGTYDEIHMGTPTGVPMAVNLKAGKDRYVAELCHHFPGAQNRASVEEWVRRCTEASRKDLFFHLKVSHHHWLSRLINCVASTTFFAHTQKTADQVAREVAPHNPQLRAALLGQCGDYGALPSQESFFLHASVANHYFEGGFYPRGGSDTIASKIIPVIEQGGGRCLVGQGVAALLLSPTASKVVGVELENGDRIHAPQIISACGVFNTYRKLLPPHAVPRGIMAKVDQVGTSCTMLCLFVGMRGTPTELRLRSSNLWHWPQADYDAMMASFKADPHSAPLPYFLGFPCAKDSTWETRYPNRSNAVILTSASFDWFAPWASTSWPQTPQGQPGKRGTGQEGASQEDYDQLKDMFQARLLEALYAHYPQCRGRVEYAKVGTSLTFNHYLRSHQGEVYGLASHPTRFQADDWLRPRTPVGGLFMTGQDVTTLGVTGALMSGVLTAHAALGYGTLTDLISGRNLVEDLEHLTV